MSGNYFCLAQGRELRSCFTSVECIGAAPTEQEFYEGSLKISIAQEKGKIYKSSLIIHGKACRAGKVKCRQGDPPQAENPAKNS